MLLIVCTVCLLFLCLSILDQKGRALEALLVALVSGEKAGSPDVAGLGEDMACLANVLDLSLLKHKDRDALIETLHKYRSSVEYDMVQAWEARCRKWYGDRFDFKSNMVREGSIGAWYQCSDMIVLYCI